MESCIEVMVKTREYLKYIEDHYNNVQKAWLIIKKKGCEKKYSLIYDMYDLHCDIRSHDRSKLSKEEFVPYRRKFFPTEYEKKNCQKEINRDFKNAWIHHKLHNRHHWETWSKEIGNPLSGRHIVHNICDWMAMGMKFGDTAQSYYEKNKEKIRIPEWSIEFIYDTFKYINKP